MVGEDGWIDDDRNYCVGPCNDDIQHVSGAMYWTIKVHNQACSTQNDEETDRRSKRKFRSPAMMTGAAWTATHLTRSAKSTKKAVIAASEPIDERKVRRRSLHLNRQYHKRFVLRQLQSPYGVACVIEDIPPSFVFVFVASLVDRLRTCSMQR